MVSSGMRQQTNEIGVPLNTNAYVDVINELGVPRAISSR